MARKDLESLMKALAISQAASDDLSLSPRERLRKLTTALELYSRPTEIAVGDRVTWKKGLKNRKYPDDDEFGIVVDLLPEPIFDDEQGSGSQYFREPLDMKLAVLDNDGDLAFYYYDSKRFRRYEDE